MSIIQKLILREQAAVKEAKEKLAAIEQAEAALKVLRSEVTKPPKIDLKLMEQTKKAEEVKRELKFKSQVNKDLDSRMKLFGWMCYHYNEKIGIRTYGRHDMPDYRVKLQSGKFSIFFKNVEINGGITMQVYEQDGLKYTDPTKFCKIGKQ